jgi:hypothetical protein
MPQSSSRSFDFKDAIFRTQWHPRTLFIRRIEKHIEDRPSSKGPKSDFKHVTTILRIFVITWLHI